LLGVGRPGARSRLVRPDYGLHPRAPYARLDTMGAAFLVASSADAVLAWSLCHAPSAAAAAKVG